MPRIGRRASCTISLIMSAITLAAVAVAAIFMPRIVDAFCGIRGDMADVPFYLHHSFILIVAYLILADVAACNTVLLSLLLAIRREQVFSSANVARIRAVSWGCIAALAPKFYVSAAVAFIAFFVGLCLRIVKNAFEEAVALKEENDFTI